MSAALDTRSASCRNHFPWSYSLILVMRGSAAGGDLVSTVEEAVGAFHGQKILQRGRPDLSYSDKQR